MWERFAAAAIVLAFTEIVELAELAVITAYPLLHQVSTQYQVQY